MKHRIIIVWSEEKNFVGLCREWKSQTVSSFCCLCVEMCVRVFFSCEDSKDNEITNYGIRDVELKRLIEYLCLKSELGKKHFFSVTKLGWDCPLNYIYYIKSIWRIHKKSVFVCVFSFGVFEWVWSWFVSCHSILICRFGANGISHQMTTTSKLFVECHIYMMNRSSTAVMWIMINLNQSTKYSRKHQQQQKTNSICQLFLFSIYF